MATVHADKPTTTKAALKGSTAPAPTTGTTGTGAAWFSCWVHDGWRTDEAGPRPTRDMLAIASALVTHGYNGRNGVENMHIAMCFRPGGCTVKQYTNILGWATNPKLGPGGPANNKRAKLVEALGLARQTDLTGPGTGGKAFHLHLTAKGRDVCAAAGLDRDMLAKFMAAPTDTPKPPKAAKADKPAASKPAKADKPTSEPAKPAGALPAPAGTATAPAQKPTSEAAKPTTGQPANNTPPKPQGK